MLAQNLSEWLDHDLFGVVDRINNQTELIDPRMQNKKQFLRDAVFGRFYQMIFFRTPGDPGDFFHCENGDKFPLNR